LKSGGRRVEKGKGEHLGSCGRLARPGMAAGKGVWLTAPETAEPRKGLAEEFIKVPPPERKKRW